MYYPIDFDEEKDKVWTQDEASKFSVNDQSDIKTGKNSNKKNVVMNSYGKFVQELTFAETP